MSYFCHKKLSIFYYIVNKITFLGEITYFHWHIILFSIFIMNYVLVIKKLFISTLRYFVSIFILSL